MSSGSCNFSNPFRSECIFCVDVDDSCAKSSLIFGGLRCNTKSVTYLGLARSKFAVELCYGFGFDSTSEKIIQVFRTCSDPFDSFPPLVDL